MYILTYILVAVIIAIIAGIMTYKNNMKYQPNDDECADYIPGILLAIFWPITFPLALILLVACSFGYIMANELRLFSRFIVKLFDKNNDPNCTITVSDESKTP